MDKKKKRNIYILLIIILVAAFLLQVAVSGFHEPGLYILIGLLGSVGLIILAKKILAPLLQRPEDYYEGGKKR